MGRGSLIVACAAVLIAAMVPFRFTASAQVAPDGEQLYKQRCAACHQIAAGKPSVAGPNLYGVVGRGAARSPVPYNYSEALKKSGLAWTPANLDKYLAAPRQVVPGTKMVVALPNAAQRTAVIEYMARTN